MLVGPDIGGDGEHAQGLQFGEDGRGDEAAHADGPPAYPLEPGVHLLQAGDPLDPDPGRVQPVEVAGVGLVLEVGGEPGEDVPPDRLVPRRIGPVLLRHHIPGQMGGQKTSGIRHGDLKTLSR